MPPKKNAEAPAPTASKRKTALKPQQPAARQPHIFALGDVLVCRLTGVQGIAVSCIEYLYGCRRWGLLPGLNKDGVPGEWLHFDEPQLERVATYAGKPATPPVTGGPRPDAPAR